ncbi:MAG: hypothetical protein QOF24_2328 [Verrucomicrobiota bacterium]|jgi:hypothetical protein
MNKLTDELGQAIADTMQDISRAAERHDVTVLEHLTKKASELRAMKEQVAAIENRLRAMQNGTHAVPTHATNSGAIRELVVEVTQGMINQNLLTLSAQMRRGLIRSGEKLSIEAQPSGDRFETELLASGNKLRERGRIARFYRDAGVRAGDCVALREVTPGHWQLKKADIVRYRRV